jgi:uncharacterized protein (DUF433 family)
MTEISYQHIRLDEKNVPILTGTTMKVIELVVEHIAYGWSPEELKYQHPYLELGQIYSALAYYYDHKEKLDRDIENRLKRASEIEEITPPTLLRQKLAAKGLL